MANNYNNEVPAPVESTDRGMFDFMKKKDDAEAHNPSEAYTLTSGMEKVHVSEPAELEEKKHDGLVEKFHRSNSSSSSSSDEEGDDEEKKKRKKEKKEKKKGMKEKIQEKFGHKEEHDHETNVPIEKIHVQDHVYSEPSYPAAAAAEHGHQEEEKKGGFLDKIKDKLPGQHKDKAEEHEAVAPAAEPSVEGDKDKKGFLDKIKDKIPGFHSKNGAEEKKDHEEKKEGY